MGQGLKPCNLTNPKPLKPLSPKTQAHPGPSKLCCLSSIQQQQQQQQQPRRRRRQQQQQQQQQQQHFIHTQRETISLSEKLPRFASVRPIVLYLVVCFCHSQYRCWPCRSPAPANVPPLKAADCVSERLKGRMTGVAGVMTVCAAPDSSFSRSQSLLIRLSCCAATLLEKRPL